ncbi:hypothetical protein Tco_0185312 [Tanacetum coccineum]
MVEEHLLRGDSAFLACLGHSGDIRGRSLTSLPLPPKKEVGKGKKTEDYEFETISEAEDFGQRLSNSNRITKSRVIETHRSLGQWFWCTYEGTGITPGVPDAPDYESEDDISWKLSDDDQDDEQAQDDADADNNDVNETTQDDEDDDEHDDDEKAQDDDDEEQTESDDDGDDFVHPKLTTHDDDIIHEEETDEDDSFDPTIHTPSPIMEPSFTAQTNRPPTPNPLVIQKLNNHQFLTPATTTSSCATKSPNFASLLCFDYRRKDGSYISTNKSDIQRQLYKALVDACKTDKNLVSNMAIRSYYKDWRWYSNVQRNPPLGTDRVTKRRKVRKRTRFYHTCTHQEFETGVHDEQAEEEVQHLPDCVQTFELMKGTCKSLTELEYFCEEVYKATTEKLDWINPEGRQYPHDLRQPLPLVPNSQGRRVIPFHHFINNDLEYLRGGVSSRKYSTSVTKTTAADYGHIKWIEGLVPNYPQCGVKCVSHIRKFALWGISHYGHNTKDVLGICDLKGISSVDDVRYKFKKATSTDYGSKTLNDMMIRFSEGIKAVSSRCRVKDLQLGVVKDIMKKLNLTKPDHNIRVEFSFRQLGRLEILLEPTSNQILWLFKDSGGVHAIQAGSHKDP